MKRLRFHIATLLAIVVAVGVALAALREADDLWTGATFSLSVAMLLISVLLAVHRTARCRAFWLGFALFGWAYLALAVIPATESRLITTHLLTYIDSKLPARPIVITGQTWGSGDTVITGQGWSQSSGPQLPLTTSPVQGYVGIPNGQAISFASFGAGSGTSENFVRIGHTILALLSAWLGGVISRHLHTRRRDLIPTSASLPVPASNDQSA
jgi:hypothetical protein